MNEYFTLYAQFQSNEDDCSIFQKTDSAWITAMAAEHPAYAEPSTRASILLHEKLVSTCYSGMDTYLVTTFVEDDEQYVNIYKNTY